MWKKEQNKTTPKLNISCLNDDEGLRKYQQALDTKLSNLIEVTGCATNKLKGVQTIIRETGEETVGVSKINKHTQNDDHELSLLSKKQKDLRIRIQNSKNTDQKSILKTERNKTLHNIRNRQIKLYNDEIDRKIESIKTSQNDHAMFKATRLLNQKTFENPKVEDLDGKLATRPEDILNIVSTHFKDKFVDTNEEFIPPFQGEAKPLTKEITAAEVRKSFDSLSNNKAPGKDNINGELLKYGTPLLDKTIADIYNAAFEKHENLDINSGVLIAIQKPGKKKGPPNNLRPITLLNSLRKALSIITLNRIRPQVEEYLSKNQSGFRPNRSTADVNWAHRLLAAKTLKEDTTIKISGIDMSAAFDTINRRHLLEIVKTIVDEDAYRLIHFLLSGTVIDTRINGTSSTKPFTSNVGTPQGDSLSPVLFIIYLEHALKEVRPTLAIPTNPFEEEIPNEIAYADDVDFIAKDYADVTKIQEVLKKYQLQVNTNKTEYTSVSKREHEWKEVKKSGITYR